MKQGKPNSYEFSMVMFIICVMLGAISILPVLIRWENRNLDNYEAHGNYNAVRCDTVVYAKPKVKTP